MIVNYDKLWKILIDKKMKRTDLIKQGKISSNVLARMGREEPVSLESIGKVCLILDCSIDDILESRYIHGRRKEKRCRGHRKARGSSGRTCKVLIIGQTI